MWDEVSTLFHGMNEKFCYTIVYGRISYFLIGKEILWQLLMKRIIRFFI